jgi:hypothetical protein
MVLSPDFQLVSLPGFNAVPELSSTYQTAYATYANDMAIDPQTAINVHANCQASDWFTLTFPPQPIASYVFVNRGGE